MWEITLAKLAALFPTDKSGQKFAIIVLGVVLSPVALFFLVIFSIGNAQIRFNPEYFVASESAYEVPVIGYAATRIGDPYSQEKRGMENYVDCSYLTQWAYSQAGIVIPGTAAEQAKYCDDHGCTVEFYELQPGDLIFWSYEINGRYKDITHVAIYTGNDMVIHASSSQGQVVHTSLFDRDRIVMYGRPN